MVASNGLVKILPDPLDRIGFWIILGQNVKHNPIAPFWQTMPNGSTVMEPSIVANPVNSAIAPQPAAKVVKVGDEQLRIALTSRLRKQEAVPKSQRRS